MWNTNRFGFPFGTLTANVVGTCIYAGATLLLQGTAPAAGPGVCAVVGAVTNGFAGPTLSTNPQRHPSHSPNLSPLRSFFQAA